MIDHNHYVPILKGRQGEYEALQAMSPEVKQGLTPIIEIPPVPWNYLHGRPAKTIDVHLARVGNALESSWGRERPLFIDLLWNAAERMGSGRHPVVHVSDIARARALQIVPVTGLGRDNDYQLACRESVGLDRRGLCLRLQREDFEDLRQLDDQIVALLSNVRVSVEETDLVLDLRAVCIGEEPALLGQVPALVAELPYVRNWRSLTLAGTAFPEDLMGIPPLGQAFVRRVEWALWRSLFASSKIPRLPAFGDYAIAHIQPSEVDPRLMRPSASIRYATERDWLVIKARNLRDYGYGQFRDVSARLLARPEYRGEDFSWGTGTSRRVLIARSARETLQPGER